MDREVTMVGLNNSPQTSSKKQHMSCSSRHIQRQLDHGKDFTCLFCEQIVDLKLEDESGTNFTYKPDQKTHFRGAKNDHRAIWFPDRCGNFLKLALTDRREVLSKLYWCLTCGIKHSYFHKSFDKNTDCDIVWKTRMSQARCNGNSKQCKFFWAICSRHLKQNENKFKAMPNKCGWKMYPHKNAEGHQENTILHFKAHPETFQVPCQAQSTLDLPAMQNISHGPEQTDTEDEEYENASKVSVSTSKILFVYEAISDSGSEIQIMADGEATIALANKDDLANIGPSIFDANHLHFNF